MVSHVGLDEFVGKEGFGSAGASKHLGTSAQGTLPFHQNEVRAVDTNHSIQNPGLSEKHSPETFAVGVRLDNRHAVGIVEITEDARFGKVLSNLLTWRHIYFLSLLRCMYYAVKWMHSQPLLHLTPAFNFNCDVVAPPVQEGHHFADLAKLPQPSLLSFDCFCEAGADRVHQSFRVRLMVMPPLPGCKAYSMFTVQLVPGA